MYIAKWKATEYIPLRDTSCIYHIIFKDAYIKYTVDSVTLPVIIINSINFAKEKKIEISTKSCYTTVSNPRCHA